VERERSSASSPAAELEPSGDRGFTAAISVLALLPRLYVALAWAREPVWDGHYYDFGARRIAAGLGYSDDIVVAGQTVWHPWCHYPVGYSGFLAGVYRLFGDGPKAATIANAIVGALTVAAVHRLARYATGTTRARIAAALVAASPGLIAYSALLMTEPLAGFGLVCAALAAVHHRERRPLLGAVIAGVVLGLTTLVRPQTLLAIPALVFLFVDTRRVRETLRRALLASGLAGLLCFAVVVPWTVRNCRVMDGCALVSTNAGWNLAIGSFPRATGRFETLRATDGCPIVSGQVQQDRCWMNEGLRWIRSDPKRFASLVPTKLAQTFDHESFPLGYLGEADPRTWTEDRKATGRKWLTLSFRALLAVAPLGLIGWPRRKRLRALAFELASLALVIGLASLAFLRDEGTFWPLAISIPVLAAIPRKTAPNGHGVIGSLAFAVGSVCLTHAVFFGEDRYHVVITPALCVLAACALSVTDEPSPTRVDSTNGAA